MVEDMIGVMSNISCPFLQRVVGDFNSFVNEHAVIRCHREGLIVTSMLAAGQRAVHHHIQPSAPQPLG